MIIFIILALCMAVLINILYALTMRLIKKIKTKRCRICSKKHCGGHGIITMQKRGGCFLTPCGANVETFKDCFRY